MNIFEKDVKKFSHKKLISDHNGMTTQTLKPNLDHTVNTFIKYLEIY